MAKLSKRGLYRFRDQRLGQCARVSYSAGDAAPILEEELYEALNFQPSFAALPTREEYDQHRPAWAKRDSIGPVV